MNKIDTGGPAFPFTCQGPTTAPEIYYGMTLRDYFAAEAMKGMIEAFGYKSDESNNFVIPDAVPTFAYHLADGMLKARSE